MVSGTGRSGLAAGYRPRRLGLDFVILHAQNPQWGPTARSWCHAGASPLPGKLPWMITASVGLSAGAMLSRSFVRDPMTKRLGQPVLRRSVPWLLRGRSGGPHPCGEHSTGPRPWRWRWVKAVPVGPRVVRPVWVAGADPVPPGRGHTVSPASVAPPSPIAGACAGPSRPGWRLPDCWWAVGSRGFRGRPEWSLLSLL